MSSRTVEATKAIRLAWERERELIQNGKGTRDWTEEQQRTILDPEIGKAYDDDGRAFNGHHMKSAEKYPNFQGFPDNIQFLTREEHLEAHQGSWLNPTNGYYDYITGITYDFSNDGFIPCKIINLSNPVVTIDSYSIETEAEPLEQTRKEQTSGTDPPILISHQPIATPPSVSKTTKNAPTKQVAKKAVFVGLKNIVNAVKAFQNKHPVLTTVTEVGVGLVLTAAAGKAISTIINRSERTGHSLLSNQSLGSVAESIVDTASKYDFKNSESTLKQLGYTVAKGTGLSDIDRQRILKEIITNGTMSKDAICAHLECIISLHKNQNSFSTAVSKWRLDLAYIKGNL